MFEKWIRKASTNATDAVVDHVTEDSDGKIDILARTIVEKTKAAIQEALASDTDWIGIGWDVLKLLFIGGGLIFGATRKPKEQPKIQATPPIIINNYYDREKEK